MKSAVPMALLGINIDHVATLRQARRETFPDPVRAAQWAIEAGADGITAHLREDRRHIQDSDIVRLKNEVKAPLNLEMATHSSVVEVAERVKPAWACLVPEKREELTTEGGLNVQGNATALKETIGRLHKAGIKVSLFIEPEPLTVEASKEVGADAVEFHTGVYARQWADGRDKAKPELDRILKAALNAQQKGLIVNAGHGIDYKNVVDLARIFQFHEFNIGFAIIGHAVFVGLKQAVKEMKEKI